MIQCFVDVAWYLQYAVLMYQTVMLLSQHFIGNILAIYGCIPLFCQYMLVFLFNTVIYVFLL